MPLADTYDAGHYDIIQNICGAALIVFFAFSYASRLRYVIDAVLLRYARCLRHAMILCLYTLMPIY